MLDAVCVYYMDVRNSHGRCGLEDFFECLGSGQGTYQLDNGFDWGSLGLPGAIENDFALFKAFDDTAASWTIDKANDESVPFGGAQDINDMAAAFAGFVRYDVRPG